MIIIYILLAVTLALAAFFTVIDINANHFNFQKRNLKEIAIEKGISETIKEEHRYLEDLEDDIAWRCVWHYVFSLFTALWILFIYPKSIVIIVFLSLVALIPLYLPLLIERRKFSKFLILAQCGKIKGKA